MLQLSDALLQRFFDLTLGCVDCLSERLTLLGRQPTQQLHLRCQFAGFAQILHTRLLQRGLIPPPGGRGGKAHQGTRLLERKAAVHAGGPQQIVTPMPGRIVRVLVKPGDIVSARQGLIVIEAMKMENELRASGPGTVAEVRVSEGALVEANSVLMVIA